MSWIAPSITPLTNLNSGFRVYEVDSAVRVVNYSGLARLAHIHSRHLTSSMPTRALHTNSSAERTGMTIRGIGGGVM